MPTKTIQPGDTVDVAINDIGGPYVRELGVLRGIVLNAGGEYDVIISPAEDPDDANELLGRVDMTLEELREGAVYVLRNCQPEELTLVRSEDFDS